ncbi:MAG: M55 family metallopeptidase [Candidatus Sumerlaeaceae bacterium]
MRVQMWCDMEGVAGITHWDQVNGGAPLYEEGRRLYTQEINAAVRGAKRAGATEIVVIDGHGAGGGWTMNSWITDQLEPGAEYITGFRWGCYVEDLQTGCDALLLPGAHAMAGTSDGVLCHTMSSANWVNAYINGQAVGESGIIAAIAGSFGVPVVFVSGDTAACREVAALLGASVTQAAVKKGLGRYSARSMAPSDACTLIETKVHEVLTNQKSWPKPYKAPGPAEFKVELHTSDHADQYLGRVGLEIVNARTVVSRGETFWQVWDQFWKR